MNKLDYLLGEKEPDALDIDEMLYMKNVTGMLSLLLCAALCLLHRLVPDLLVLPVLCMDKGAHCIVL